jgi:hypothetical protein
MRGATNLSSVEKNEEHAKNVPEKSRCDYFGILPAVSEPLDQALG